MKRFKAFALALGLFLLTSVTMFAQDSTAYSPGGGLETSLSKYFVSLGAIVALVVLVASWINGKLKLAGTMKQIVAWLVSMCLCFAGWFLGAGFLEGLSVYLVLVYGFAAGLAANGIFDIVLIQAFLKLVGLEKTSVPTDGGN